MFMELQHLREQVAQQDDELGPETQLEWDLNHTKKMLADKKSELKYL